MRIGKQSFRNVEIVATAGYRALVWKLLVASSVTFITIGQLLELKDDMHSYDGINVLGRLTEMGLLNLNEDCGKTRRCRQLIKMDILAAIERLKPAEEPATKSKGITNVWPSSAGLYQDPDVALSPSHDQELDQFQLGMVDSDNETVCRSYGIKDGKRFLAIILPNGGDVGIQIISPDKAEHKTILVTYVARPVTPNVDANDLFVIREPRLIDERFVLQHEMCSDGHTHRVTGLRH